MEIFITCQDKSSTEHLLRIVKKIGEGKFDVYHVYSASKKANYALKVFPKTSSGASHYKKELFSSNFQHLNIIQHIPLQCVSSDFYGLITEYAKYGDLLALITLGGPLENEILIRTYFKQLIEGLEYVHSQNVAHLDLKLENLVLVDDFTLKIIDFDQAQSIADIHMVSAGTENCRAPEVIENKCRDLAAADIYSAGVILYTLKVGQYPFIETNGAEGICVYPYSLFTKNNRKFWEDKNACLEGGAHFDSDFIEIVNGMLECDSEKRFTIQQIKDSKWFRGRTLSKENLKVEMRTLWNTIFQEQKTEL